METNSEKSIHVKLAEISSLCEPAEFEKLFGTVKSFCDLTLSIIELHDRNHHLPFDLVSELIDLNRMIGSAIVESYTKGLFHEYEASNESQGSRRKASALARKLHKPYLQGQFLLLLKSASLTLLARCLLDDLHDIAAVWTAWDIALPQLRHFPALAKLMRNQPFGPLRALISHLGSPTGFYKEINCEMIDLADTISLTENDAWGAWFEAQQESGEAALGLMDECATKLGLVANFLLFTDTAAWPITHFDTLREGQSLSAIVRELCGRKLRPIIDEKFRARAAELNVSHDIDELWSQHRLYWFQTGLIRSKTYLVKLPLSSCLVETSSFSSELEYRENPLEFVRKHWHIIPHSQHTRQLRSELEEVNSAVRDAKLQKRLEGTLSGAVEEVGPEALTLLIVEASGLPHEATLVLSPIVRRVFNILGKRVHVRL